jgi:hypothetical protein
MNSVEAARTVIETITMMAQQGRPLMQRVLPGDGAHYWEHYPDDDARDSQTLSRWYYHVHSPGERDPGEHGHFHLFLHRSQIDPAATPWARPAEGEDALAHVTHIAGLSIDRQGVPISWFTTNRWVTDEFMYPAQTMIAHLDRYSVDHTPEDGAVNRFLTAMVALYRDEIGELLIERDKRLAELSAGEEGREVFDAGNDVLSVRPIDLDAKIESLGVG